MQELNAEASFDRPREKTPAGHALLDIPIALLTKAMARLGLLSKDLDYHLMRASLVLI